MYLDYCAINHIPKKKTYLLPHIKKLVQPLGGSTYFSMIDLASVYHQNRICAVDRQKTAFPTIFGLHEWTVLPCALADAPSQFV